VTRSDEPAKLNVTVVPGLAASKSLPSSVKVAWRDAAANTVIEPAGAVLAEADGVAVDASGVPLEHAAAPVTMAAAITTDAMPRVDNFTIFKPSLRGFQR
jgi:hypothetical protein